MERSSDITADGKAVEAEIGEDHLALSGGQVHPVERPACAVVDTLTSAADSSAATMIVPGMPPETRKLPSAGGPSGERSQVLTCPAPPEADTRRIRRARTRCRPSPLGTRRAVRLGERLGVEEANEVVVAADGQRLPVGAEPGTDGARHLERGLQLAVGQVEDVDPAAGEGRDQRDQLTVGVDVDLGVVTSSGVSISRIDVARRERRRR